MSKTYTFTWNNAKLASVRNKVSQGLVKMGMDIANKAESNAPVGVYPPKSHRTGGALVNSIRSTTDNKDNVYVIAGGEYEGKLVPYARRREYENNKNPGKKHYMGNAFEEVRKDYTKYFKGITS